MPAKQYEELPLMPEEATDLKLHVKNCIARHTALVLLIKDAAQRRVKDQFYTWAYRSLVLPGLAFLAFELWKIWNLLAKTGLS